MGGLLPVYAYMWPEKQQKKLSKRKFICKDAEGRQRFCWRDTYERMHTKNLCGFTSAASACGCDSTISATGCLFKIQHCLCVSWRMRRTQGFSIMQRWQHPSMNNVGGVMTFTWNKQATLFKIITRASVLLWLHGELGRILQHDLHSQKKLQTQTI